MTDPTIFEHRVVGPLACNCYIVGDAATKQVVVIDPGGAPEELAALIQRNGWTVTGIVATHAHFDHILAAQSLRSLTGAPFHLHRADRPLLDWWEESGSFFLGADLPPAPDVDNDASEGDKIAAGEVALEILHTPGHSPGSISLVGEAIVFSGDTLFADSIGRTDLPGGDTDALLSSVRDKLFPLGDELPVYPGHGPATTLGTERRSNPFVGMGAGLWLPPERT